MNKALTSTLLGISSFLVGCGTQEPTGAPSSRVSAIDAVKESRPLNEVQRAVLLTTCEPEPTEENRQLNKWREILHSKGLKLSSSYLCSNGNELRLATVHGDIAVYRNHGQGFEMLGISPGPSAQGGFRDAQHKRRAIQEAGLALGVITGSAPHVR